MSKKVKFANGERVVVQVPRKEKKSFKVVIKKATGYVDRLVFGYTVQWREVKQIIKVADPGAAEKLRLQKVFYSTKHMGDQEAEAQFNQQQCEPMLRKWIKLAKVILGSFERKAVKFL